MKGRPFSYLFVFLIVSMATILAACGDEGPTNVTNVDKPPAFKGGIIKVNSNTYTTTKVNGSYVFDPVPFGTDLAEGSAFTIRFDKTGGAVARVTFAGPDGNLFSVQAIGSGGYIIKMSGPTLRYKHSASGQPHRYQFKVTVENAAGQSTVQTFIIPVQLFAGGSGTASDPYRVANVQQLQAVGQFLDAHFVQIQDINAFATQNWNNGKGFNPIGSNSNPFTGHYDGNGYVIKNLTIERPNQSDIGLFGVIGSAGIVKKVHLVGGSITGEYRVGALAGVNSGTILASSAGSTVKGQGSVGGLVGEHGHSGIIKSSYATGRVSGHKRVGGLVGSIQSNSIIQTSYATGKVIGDKRVGGLVGSNFGTVKKSYATGEVTGTSSVGGLVGYNNGIIQTSYATGAVNGDTEVGGLVGYNVGKIINTFATGRVSGNNDVGGLVGYKFTGPLTTGTVIDSYWDTQTTGQSSSAGGTGLMTSQMTGADASKYMDGFDFMNVWKETSGYPVLRGVGGQ